MSFLQTVQHPMCLNNLSCNFTDKIYMYNCIPTNMHEFELLSDQLDPLSD